jgi:SAM-dependent methyltransferase
VAGRSKGLVQAVKPLFPVVLKRPVKRVIPSRYHRLFDPNWHRKSIGSHPFWERLGRMQLDYLVREGLQPSHSLLDVGCGPLRGGIYFLRYLEAGRYYGIDKRDDVLDEALRVEVPRHGLEHKRPTLLADDKFRFARFGRQFDYAIAQSVFTHLPLNDIIRCLMEMERALAPRGRFYATFYLNPGGKRNLEDIRQTPTVTSHFDEDSFHYDVATFEWICAGTELEVENLGPWDHPHNQQMLRFAKRG